MNTELPSYLTLSICALISFGGAALIILQLT